MKIRIIFLMFCIMAITPTVFATTLKLFDPVAIAQSTGTFNSIDDAVAFGTKEIYLTCPASGATASITGPNGGGFVIDNFLSVNGVNVCTDWVDNSCFHGLDTDPLPLVGSPVEEAYIPTGPLDISLQLIGGTHLYNFRMMDWGYTLGSSEVDLNTSCVQGIPVCHKDSGKKTDKTIYVDSPSAVSAHVTQHADTTGPCADGH
jgi:hypothetical protein